MYWWKIIPIMKSTSSCLKNQSIVTLKSICSIAINSFLVTQRVWEWGCEVFNDLQMLIFLELSCGFALFFLFFWWWWLISFWILHNRILMFLKQNIWKHGALCPIDLLCVFNHFLPSCLISMMAIKGAQERCVCHSWGACLTTTHGQLAWTYLLLQMKHSFENKRLYLLPAEAEMIYNTDKKIWGL